MDPDETLRMFRANLKQMMVDTDQAVFAQHALDAAEHFEALDEWLSKGGFKPREWA
jgi:hypothetical protein